MKDTNHTDNFKKLQRELLNCPYVGYSILKDNQSNN